MSTIRRSRKPHMLYSTGKEKEKNTHQTQSDTNLLTNNNLLINDNLLIQRVERKQRSVSVQVSEIIRRK